MTDVINFKSNAKTPAAERRAAAAAAQVRLLPSIIALLDLIGQEAANAVDICKACDASEPDKLNAALANVTRRVREIGRVVETAERVAMLAAGRAPREVGGHDDDIPF